MLPKEYNWFITHPEIENKYSGEYIAILGESIVSHGINLKEVLKEAEQKGEKPYIHKVPQSEKELVV